MSESKDKGWLYDFPVKKIVEKKETEVIKNAEGEETETKKTKTKKTKTKQKKQKKTKTQAEES